MVYMCAQEDVITGYCGTFLFIPSVLGFTERFPSRWSNKFQKLNISVASALMFGGEVKQKGGRPSLSQLESSFEKEKRKEPPAPDPDKSVGLDNGDHWPKFADKKHRCKLPDVNIFQKFFA